MELTSSDRAERSSSTSRRAQTVTSPGPMATSNGSIDGLAQSTTACALYATIDTILAGAQRTFAQNERSA